MNEGTEQPWWEVPPAREVSYEAADLGADDPAGLPGDVVTCDACYSRHPLEEFQLRGQWHLCSECCTELDAAQRDGDVEDIDTFVTTHVLNDELLEDPGF